MKGKYAVSFLKNVSAFSVLPRVFRVYRDIYLQCTYVKLKGPVRFFLEFAVSRLA